MQRIRILSLYREFSLQKKAALWYIVCNILQKGIAFFVVPIYVHFLSTSEYGQYSIFQSWCNIIIIFATLCLQNGVFTKAMVDFLNDRDRYTSSMQSLGTLASLVIFLIFIFFAETWERILEMDYATTLLMFLYFVVSPAFSFWSVRQRVEYKYKKMVMLTLLQSLVTPIISVYLLIETSLRVNAVIWGFLIGQILFGMYFYIFHYYKGKCFYHRKYWVHALKFNIPLLPHYLSLIVLSQIDRILIGHYNGKDKAGIYSLAFQVAVVISIFVQGINNSFVPWIYEKFKNKEFLIVKSQTKKLCVFVGIIVLIYMLIAPEIVLLIGTDEYMEAIWVIPAVTLSIYVTFCYGLFACVEFYYNETTYIMIATTSGALISFLLNNLLLPRFGFLSAGYTSLFCYVLFMFMHYHFQKKICFNKLGIKQIFDNSFILLSCLFLFVIMLFCLIVYNINLLRYLLIVVLSYICIVKRRNVYSILNK